MLINQVMEETGLTRKAIYYYESEGLVSPDKNPRNNYREFTVKDLEKLKKINLLRKYGFSITKIKKLFSGEVNLENAILEKIKTIEEELESLETEKEILSNLIKQDSEDILRRLAAEESKFESAAKEREDYLLKEFLRLFPGKLGYIFAAVNSSYLLDSKLDDEKKKAAWKRLINKLDSYNELKVEDQLAGIFDKLYKKYDEKYLTELKNNSVEITDDIISGKKDPAKLLKEVKNSPKDFDITEKEETLVNQYLVREIQPIMSEVGEELKIISPRFKAFSEKIERMEIDDELEDMIPEV